MADKVENCLGVIAIGYNRPASMQRLLTALQEAEYEENDQVLLIISIDNSGNDDVEQIAQKFQWAHGKKIIRTYETRQGLRNHILKCGSYIEEYDLDAVAVFEDDIYPSADYYNYMKQAVEYYQEDDNIAGISLYSHRWNTNANMPFEPQPGNSDVYFMSFASSWGQIWMKKQWNAFMEWYDKHPVIKGDYDVPEAVASWPDSSWLKYHITYCTKMQKYFVYPYQSLTTCFTDQGEHTVEHITLYHVPVSSKTGRAYQFETCNKTSICYDAYFERRGLEAELNLEASMVTVDLYGKRCNVEKTPYLLTERILPYKIVSSYALELRPHEENVVHHIAGRDIFLYDQRVSSKSEGEITPNIMSYYFRVCKSGKWLIQYVIQQKMSIWKEKRRAIKHKK